MVQKKQKKHSSRVGKVGSSDETMIDQSQKRPSLCVNQAEALNATN